MRKKFVNSLIVFTVLIAPIFAKDCKNQFKVLTTNYTDKIESGYVFKSKIDVEVIGHDGKQSKSEMEVEYSSNSVVMKTGIMDYYMNSSFTCIVIHSQKRIIKTKTSPKINIQEMFALSDSLINAIDVIDCGQKGKKYGFTVTQEINDQKINIKYSYNEDKLESYSIVYLDSSPYQQVNYILKDQEFIKERSIEIEDVLRADEILKNYEIVNNYE